MVIIQCDNSHYPYSKYYAEENMVNWMKEIRKQLWFVEWMYLQAYKNSIKS